MQIDKETSSVEFFVFSMDGLHEVLGVNWLKMLGPILWNFETLTMHFKREGKIITLHGIQLEILPQLHTIQATPTPTPTLTETLEKLLLEFSDLFNEPTELPPIRSCDHKIFLLPRTAPIVVQPY